MRHVLTRIVAANAAPQLIKTRIAGTQRWCVFVAPYESRTRSVTVKNAPYWYYSHLEELELQHLPDGFFRGKTTTHV